MRLFNFIKKTNIVKGTKLNDKVVIETAEKLNKLYEIINNERIEAKKRKYLMLRIKDEMDSKNCTITSIDQFKKKVNERKTTIGYELTVGYIIGDESDEEWEKISKIVVKVDNSDIIKIDFQNEISQEIFDKVLIDIESMIKNKYNKQVEINYITRDKSKPKVEFIDFGILGRYKYNMINYQTDEEMNIEQRDIQTRKVINEYYLQINEINKKIFYKIYDELRLTDYKIWESASFDIIIDRKKLPYNFDDLNDQQKTDIIYIYDYNDYIDLWNKINEIKPFWDLNKIKEDVKITNVAISEKIGTISIEFNGIFDFFTAYIELDYKKNYDVKKFDPS
ncbi:MAG: hypothetical protein ACI33S_04550 [Bacilli bacterium]